MFIGFIGFMWLMGYSAIWISIISTIGQLVAWIWLYKYIQKEGNERNIRSLSSLVANVKGAPEAKMAAICSVAFLLIYAGAQLSSGGKALFAMLGWAEWVGIIIGFVLVSILLRWWNSCIYLDRRSPILCNDRRFNIALLRCSV